MHPQDLGNRLLRTSTGLQDAYLEAAEFDVGTRWAEFSILFSTETKSGFNLGHVLFETQSVYHFIQIQVLKAILCCRGVRMAWLLSLTILSPVRRSLFPLRREFELTTSCTRWVEAVCRHKFSHIPSRWHQHCEVIKWIWVILRVSPFLHLPGFFQSRPLLRFHVHHQRLRPGPPIPVFWPWSSYGSTQAEDMHSNWDCKETQEPGLHSR